MFVGQWRKRQRFLETKLKHHSIAMLACQKSNVVCVFAFVNVCVTLKMMHFIYILGIKQINMSLCWDKFYAWKHQVHPAHHRQSLINAMKWAVCVRVFSLFLHSFRLCKRIIFYLAKQVIKNGSIETR